MENDFINAENSVKFSQTPTVALDDEKSELLLIDQTLLPGELRVLQLTEPEQFFEAIQSLRVRGAPAIGVAAAFALYLAVKNSRESETDSFLHEIEAAAAYLAKARPTAVNLFWALERMQKAARQCNGKSVTKIKAALKKEAATISEEDGAICRKIGENGLSLFKRGDGILTHCNAGRLATMMYGTALAPIYVGQERGYGFHVYADETRPLLQGARLTSAELLWSGVDVTLICDNMASYVMKKGWINAVITGCDRVAANGDAANKIGTSGVAILAKYYHIPFYIACPLSTLDQNCASGDEIPIEQRAPEEVTRLWYEKPMAPEGVKVCNPAFDSTDAELITAYITEKGIVRPPFRENFRRIV